jgi:insulysin
MMVMNTVQGFRILIQSEKSCDFLEKRIDNFLINFEKELEEMSEGDFEKHKIGLINKRLEKLKNLSEESGRLWHHVASEAFDFDLGKLTLVIDTHLRKANKSLQYTATSNTSSLSQKPISNSSSAPTSTLPPRLAPRPQSTSSPKAKP